MKTAKESMIYYTIRTSTNRFTVTTACPIQYSKQFQVATLVFESFEISEHLTCKGIATEK